MALYGHDTCGLGHLRRNLALAAALRGSPLRPEVLVITGSPQAQRFPRPPGVELLVLPAVRKDSDGRYAAATLDVPLEDVVAVRSATAAAALRAWRPDLLVVDKVPGGFRGEMLEALSSLRATGRTRTVLGLRDVLDEPAAALAEWRRDGAAAALARSYDEVWVYGDPSVHDLREDLRMTPAERAATRFLGYLAADRPAGGAEPLPKHDPGARTVLASVGGGGDGAQLTRALLAAPLPAGVELVLLPGPYAPTPLRAELEAAAHQEGVHVVPFTDAVGEWAAAADAVVCMGGYNSVAEVLATTTPALVVPRTRPRREQEVRARALASAGMLDVATDPDPQQIAAWVRGALRRAPVLRGDLALDGLSAARRRATHLLGHLPAARAVGAGAPATPPAVPPLAPVSPLTPRERVGAPGACAPVPQEGVARAC
ncbi:glycosyltransferase family protein [Kineococcus sp. SYSU DK006]|uniref:glycosyltransferase family protein n=1 Tax=Kineococcus sp. SYSU DK006 TaxID=3383127 RepID=UPI003D7C94D8